MPSVSKIAAPGLATARLFALCLVSALALFPLFSLAVDTRIELRGESVWLVYSNLPTVYRIEGTTNLVEWFPIVQGWTRRPDAVTELVIETLDASLYYRCLTVEP